MIHQTVIYQTYLILFFANFLLIVWIHDICLSKEGKVHPCKNKHDGSSVIYTNNRSLELTRISQQIIVIKHIGATITVNVKAHRLPIYRQTSTKQRSSSVSSFSQRRPLTRRNSACWSSAPISMQHRTVNSTSALLSRCCSNGLD
jgi:hypothetical protein